MQALINQQMKLKLYLICLAFLLIGHCSFAAQAQSVASLHPSNKDVTTLLFALAAMIFILSKSYISRARSTKTKLKAQH